MPKARMILKSKPVMKMVLLYSSSFSISALIPPSRESRAPIIATAVYLMYSIGIV